MQAGGATRRVLSYRSLTFTEPRVWLSILGSKVPALWDPIDHDWSETDPNWFVYDAYVNGLTRTYNNPKDSFTTSDGLSLGERPNGQGSVTVGTQSRTPSRRFLKWLNGLATALKEATPAVVELKVTQGASSAGNVSVVLAGIVQNVAVLASDNTPAAVAAKIRAAAFAGWTAAGTGDTVIFTAAAAGDKPGANSFSGGPTGSSGSAKRTGGHGPVEASWFDPYEDNNFMIGMEGWAAPGDDPTEPKRLMRWVGFNVSQSGNSANRDDWSGQDGNLQPAMNLECQIYPVQPEQLAGTGITEDLVDPMGRETAWSIGQAA